MIITRKALDGANKWNIPCKKKEGKCDVDMSACDEVATGYCERESALGKCRALGFGSQPTADTSVLSSSLSSWKRSSLWPWIRRWIDKPTKVCFKVIQRPGMLKISVEVSICRKMGIFMSQRMKRWPLPACVLFKKFFPNFPFQQFWLKFDKICKLNTTRPCRKPSQRQ